MLSILEQEYSEKPNRPFSQKELKYMRERVFRKLKIGNTRAHHTKCNHFYYVKENGRKEKKIKEHNIVNIGYCSVCWKYEMTPYDIKFMAENLMKEYFNYFLNPPLHLTYEGVILENTFTTWLYEKII